MGDVDRRTSGLVERTKLLKGLRLGLTNPAEVMIEELQKQFEANLTMVAREIPGGIGNRELTEDEKRV